MYSEFHRSVDVGVYTYMHTSSHSASGNKSKDGIVLQFIYEEGS